MSKWALYGLVALFSAVWSSAFIAGKIALADFDAFTILVLRFVLARSFWACISSNLALGCNFRRFVMSSRSEF